MNFSGLSLPSITNEKLNDAKERKAIRDYLYQLNEQLRYTLNNLDEENLSTELTDTIQGAYTESTKLSKEMKDVQGNVSRVQQFASSLVLTVENQTDGLSSSIKLTSGGTEISSGMVKITGAVSFNDLKNEGSTEINGANISTGKINAARIDVDNLYVKHLSSADGTFSGTVSAGAVKASTITGGTISGSTISGTTISGGYISGSTISGATISGATGYFGTQTEYYINIGYPGTSHCSIFPSVDDTCNLGTSSFRFDVCYANSVHQGSSIRYKKDVHALDFSEADFAKLHPISFVYKDVPIDRQVKRLGFLAEEVYEVYPELVGLDGDGLPSSIDYSNLTVPLVGIVQKLIKRVEALEEKT